MMICDISVVMSVYGNIDSFPATIESIVRQTYQSFEIIVVDDGNELEAKKILKSYEQKYPRIRLIHNKKNEGLTKSLIIGCRSASGAVICRIDNGDLMVPSTRLATQYGFFKRNPGISVVGGRYEVVDTVNRLRFRSRKGERVHRDIVNNPPWKTYFCHVTVMMCRSSYEQAGGYNLAYFYGQDTELWPRMLAQGRGHILNEVFAIAPMWRDSISVASNHRQIKNKINKLYKGGGALQRIALAPRLFLEFLKLLLPVRMRVCLRYMKSMEFVGRIPKQSCMDLKGIAGFYRVG